MPKMIEHRRSEYVDTIEKNMKAERHAIQFNIANIDKLIPVLRSFDAKVVNKHLNEAMKEATDRTAYLEKLPHSAYFYTSLPDTGEEGLANFHRSEGFKVVFQSENPRKLDAEATIHAMLETKKLLEKAHEGYQFNRETEEMRFNRLHAIEESIEELFDECNMVSKDMLRRMTNYVRYA